jgi:hypothetical protein
LGEAVLRGAAALSLEAFRARFSAPANDAAASDYSFLLGSLVDRATLSRAEAIARQWGVYPHEVLIATGWVSAEAYTRALAGFFGLPFRREVSPDDLDSGSVNLRASIANGLIKQSAPEAGVVLSPDRRHPRDVVALAEKLHPQTLTLAPPQSVRNAIRCHFAETIAHAAVSELNTRRPEESARQNLARWQLYGPALGAAVFLAGLLVDAEIAIRTLSFILALIFIPVIALRMVALGDLIRGCPWRKADVASRIRDAELPIYTILVALYREAKILPGLLRGLTKLDYPAFGSKSTK